MPPTKAEILCIKLSLYSTEEITPCPEQWPFPRVSCLLIIYLQEKEISNNHGSANLQVKPDIASQ